MRKKVAKGAEADLYIERDNLVKERIKKKYRIKDLDERIRRLRTQREYKLLENARRAGVCVPRVFGRDERSCKIFMEKIEGRRMKDVLDKASPEEAAEIAQKIGKSLSLLHDANIIHNDLTTSNMLYKDKEVYFIDFGLGITSTRVEDKAMDLVVFKKSIKVSHTGIWEMLWENILIGYGKTKRLDEILARVKVIEKRVRYSSEL